MERITIGPNPKYKELISTVINDLQQNGVEVSPYLDSGVAKEDISLMHMKNLQREHFAAIDDSEALYVICPDGHIEAFVSTMIGYARARGKRIIFSDKPEDLELLALATSHSHVPLDKLAEIKDL